MDINEIIRARRSVRTFDGTGLAPQDAQAILEFSEKIENPYDLPITWKLLDAGQYGLNSPVIVGEKLYIAGKMRLVPHAEEAFGYSFEKVVLFAQSLGVGTTWIAGTMNRGAFEKAVNLADGEFMPCVSPLGYPAKKMSLRETMMRRGIRADARENFEKLFFDGSFDRPLRADAAGKFAQALEAVRLAPSAVNRQPWRAVVCGEKVHFYEKRGKGDAGAWDVHKVDMGIALCHFETAGLQSGLKLSLELADPALPGAEDLAYTATFAVRE